jgi:DNA polymerase III alpha subunit
VECLRKVSDATGIPKVASSDPHYPAPKDAIDQRAMVMTNMKEDEESVRQKLDSKDEMDLMVFFGSNNFYIHSFDEMSQKFTQDELEMTNKIADGIEIYDITHKPHVPEFKLPDFDKNADYLKNVDSDANKYMFHLCVEGAKRLKPWENVEVEGIKSTRNEYWNKLNQELAVIFKANLSNYFLVVWDYCMAGDYSQLTIVLIGRKT